MLFKPINRTIKAAEVVILEPRSDTSEHALDCYLISALLAIDRHRPQA
jgi:hypothetical protein